MITKKAKFLKATKPWNWATLAHRENHQKKTRTISGIIISSLASFSQFQKLRYFLQTAKLNIQRIAFHSLQSLTSNYWVYRALSESAPFREVQKTSMPAIREQCEMESSINVSILFLIKLGIISILYLVQCCWINHVKIIHWCIQTVNLFF